jgi:fumarate reductase flavoprotein subunit
MSEALQHDIVIVGGGGAGLRAAIAIAELDPSLSVAVVSKVYPMRSHTVAAEGGAAAVIKDNDSLDAHCYDTISGSDWLADQDAVELFVEEAPRELIQMEHWGCPWNREPDGRVSVRPFGGMTIERTWFAADKTGFHMLHTLFQTLLKYDEVVRYDEWFATKLLVEDGRCQGVAAIELRTGHVRCIGAKAVILCTGGAGKIFPFTTNGAIKTGDGMALAYRAGVPLKDMEFVQYHPTGLPGTGILITEAARGEGGVMYNKHGERYLRDYDLGEPLDVHDANHPQKRTMELGPRDRLSQAFVKEHEKGNTIDSPFGDVVHLDIRHLGEKRINKRLPFVRELAKNYAGIDPVHEPIPVRPVIHYMMGGIHTDIHGATPMPGLYAVGECACISINGANRLGSNSLTKLLVFGKRAGAAAATYVGQCGQLNIPAIQSQTVSEQTRITELLNRSSGTERIVALRNDMHHAMESGAGIYRDSDSLSSTCDILSQVRKRLTNIQLDDRSNCFNTELTAALELENMIDIAEAVAHSARQRTESRGSHQRTDFPERDDQKFLKHSMAYRTDDGSPRLEYLDVVITKWPPADRTYGAKPVESNA